VFARVTLFELDTVRMTLESALARFHELVLPQIREQEGYEGVYVLTTSEGKGMLMSLWSTEAAAEASVASGFYDEQVARFLMVLRSPPGRDHYQVRLADVPLSVPA